MRSGAFLLAALLCAPALAHAQAVRGTVVEEGSAQPIAGALVQVLQRGEPVAHARTDSAGVFVIPPLPRPGSILIRVTHTFYTAVDSLAVQVQPGEAVTLELRMARTTVPLEPLVVTARSELRLAGFQERMRRGDGFGHFITRSDIDARPAARTTDLLRNVAGVQVSSIGRGGADEPVPIGTPDVTNPRVQIITMQTPTGGCMPALYIDGMPVHIFADSGIDDFLKPDMIEGVEVYPRSIGAPPEFVDPNDCGVVAFWTRAASDRGGAFSWLRAAAGAAAFLLMVAITR